MPAPILTPGETVFFAQTVDNWTKPYVRKRHHEAETMTVILRGEVIEARDGQFKVKLTDNNGFEKDGETFVFDLGCLLANQNFTDFAELGQWRQNPSSNP